VRAVVQHPHHHPAPGAIVRNPAAAAGAGTPGNASIFARYIPRGYFSYVALNFTDTTALDPSLATLLHRYPLYHTIEVVPAAPRSSRWAWAPT
jgi:hypothetical protein